MEKTELHQKTLITDKGKELQSRVYKVTFETRTGAPGSFQTFEIFEPVTFIRKNDSNDGTIKTGMKDSFKNREIAITRLHEVLQLLHDIDARFNEGKAFEKLTNKIKVALQNDELPF